jgi:hypothetical protein
MLAGTGRIDRALIDAMARERGLEDLWREAQ